MVSRFRAENEGSILVAASDASDRVKQIANFVCDGTADEEEINAAVATVLGGGRVLLSEGNFTTATEIQLADNVKLFGQGAGTIIKNAADTTHNLIGTAGASNVTVADLLVDGNKDNVDTAGAATYDGLNGIRVYGGSSYVTIERVVAQNCYYSGIQLGGGSQETNSDIVVSKCTALNNRDNGINCRPGATRVTTTRCIATGQTYSGIQAIRADYVTVTGCICHDNGGASEGDGIGFEGCVYSVIQGNIVHSNSVQGIKCDKTLEGSGTRNSAHIAIVGNLIYDNGGDPVNAQGVQIINTNDSLVSDNVIDGNYFGLQCQNADNIHIANNVISNQTDLGIRIVDDTATNVTITGNRIVANGAHGMDFAGDTMVVNGNTFDQNTRAGIDVNGANLSILNNVFNANGWDGVKVESGKGAGTIIFGNIFTATDGSNYPVREVDDTAGPSSLYNNYMDASTSLANSSSVESGTVP